MSNINRLPKGILFDFDGVIVDSFKVHFASWESAFRELFDQQIVPFPKETHAGKSPILIAEYFCDQIGEKSRAHDLFLLKDKYLITSPAAPDLLPGVNEIQGFLLENNVPYGIASNATRGFVGDAVKKLSIDFPTYFGFEDYEFPKPHPEAYLSLARALGIEESDYSNTWVMEDSLTGTEAAREAGMVPIGILTQYSEEQLRGAGSQLVFPTLLEAYLYLKNNE